MSHQVIGEHARLTQVHKVVFPTNDRWLEHPVRFVINVVVFPPGSHYFKMRLNLTVTHGVIFQLGQFAIGQNVRNYVIVLTGYFHRLLRTFVKVFLNSLYYQSLLSDLQTSLFARPVYFLKSFLKLIQREYLWMCVWNAASLLWVDRNKYLSFVFMQKTLFPEINKFLWYFPLPAKSIMIGSLGLT